MALNKKNINDFVSVESFRAGCFEILEACDDISKHTNARNIRRINTVRNYIIAFLLALQG